MKTQRRLCCGQVAAVVVLFLVAAGEVRGLATRRGLDWTKVDARAMDAKFGRPLPARRSAPAVHTGANSSLWEVIPGRHGAPFSSAVLHVTCSCGRKGTLLDFTLAQADGHGCGTRYPKTESLPDVLARVPDTPQGRNFVKELADTIFLKFGIWVRHGLRWLADGMAPR